MIERLMQKNGIIYAGKQTVKGWLFAEKRGKKWVKTVRVDFVFETFFALCIAHIIILFIFELMLLDLYPFFYLIFNG